MALMLGGGCHVACRQQAWGQLTLCCTPPTLAVATPRSDSHFCSRGVSAVDARDLHHREAFTHQTACRARLLLPCKDQLRICL